MALENQARYRLGGMDCASCAAKIETAIGRMPGVEAVSVSVAAATMTVRHNETSDLQAIEKRVTGLGYSIRPLGQRSDVLLEEQGALAQNIDLDHHDHPHDEGQPHQQDVRPNAHSHHHEPMEGPRWKSPKGRLTIFSGMAFVAAYGLGHLAPAYSPFIFTAALLIGLVPIARRAVVTALAGTPFSIEMLMTISAVGAVIIHASEEAAAVVFLFLVGELLEGVAASRARHGIQSLTGLMPRTALLEDHGAMREVMAADLRIGSTILVRPGERLAADGLVLSGEGAVDQSPVTGESIPVAKVAGDRVFAGTVNGQAALRIQVTAAAADNTIARVVRMVEEAQETKAPTERFIDRFSRHYTPAVVAAAALVAVLPPVVFGAPWSEWIYKGLAILLIGCPCALVISTPAAIAASLSAGAGRGLLIKGGVVLETLGKLTVVAFDKTGTLTTGRPQVTDILAFGRSAQDVLRLAASVETRSNHPLAAAILAKASEEEVEIPPAQAAEALGGKGVTAIVEAQKVFLGSEKAADALTALSTAHRQQLSTLSNEGKTVSVLVVDGRLAGAIAMRDEPRDDAKSGIDTLASMGLQTVMLTGDNACAAEAVGVAVGVEVRAGLMPQDKQRIVLDLKREGQIVAKVGDGINDAPALAAADVGIAMGGGTDVALETADAAILGGRVGDVAAMIHLSRRTMRNIRQNIAIALGLKVVFLVTTIAGLTGLWPAILADTGATVLVTINALRLLNVEKV